MAPGTASLALRTPPYFCQTDHRQRCLAQLRSKVSGLEKYIYLNGLKERDFIIFYELVLANVLELIPILYTPTVCSILFLFFLIKIFSSHSLHRLATRAPIIHTFGGTPKVSIYPLNIKAISEMSFVHGPQANMLGLLLSLMVGVV